MKATDKYKYLNQLRPYIKKVSNKQFTINCHLAERLTKKQLNAVNRLVIDYNINIQTIIS